MSQENTVATEDDLCPCGSGRPYAECCAPYHEGRAWPADARTMLRSRYSAFAKHKFAWIAQSQWPVPEDMDGYVAGIEENTRGVNWLNLEIVCEGKGRPEDGAECPEGCWPEGTCPEDCPYMDYFVFYSLGDRLHERGERSWFPSKDGKIYFSISTPIVREPARKLQAKVGRNDPCPCGSGKKYKKCCGRNQG